MFVRIDHVMICVPDLAQGIAPAQLIFLAVGTPQAPDGSADLSLIWAVADSLAQHIHRTAHRDCPA